MILEVDLGLKEKRKTVYLKSGRQVTIRFDDKHLDNLKKYQERKGLNFSEAVRETARCGLASFFHAPKADLETLMASYEEAHNAGKSTALQVGSRNGIRILLGK